MTTEQSVGAASHTSNHWREVDWRLVNRNVSRLQVRIVKAVDRAVNRCFISGESNRENALSVAISSPARPDGTTITSPPGCWVALPAPPTVSSFIPNVTVNCTVVSAASTHRVSLLRRYEGLSRVSWKLSCTVLRGADRGIAARLLDKKIDNKIKQPTRSVFRTVHCLRSLACGTDGGTGKRVRN